MKSLVKQKYFAAESLLNIRVTLVRKSFPSKYVYFDISFVTSNGYYTARCKSISNRSKLYNQILHKHSLKISC